MFGFSIGILIGAIFVLVVAIMAMTRKADARTAVVSSRRIDIESPLPPAEAIQRLQTNPLGRYTLADADPARGVLVFKSSMTIFSWGFFFPVAVTPAAGGGSSVAIGIKSRALQWGPVVGNNHRDFAQAATKALAGA
jgi:hypothetical protein